MLMIGLGRTGRIGHLGVATSFYNDRNEDLASPLVKILLESKQEIPDFLEMYVPDGAREGDVKLDFGDESDDEEYHPGAANGDIGGGFTDEFGGADADANESGEEDVNDENAEVVEATSAVNNASGEKDGWGGEEEW